jgi:hypothetical protein
VPAICFYRPDGADLPFEDFTNFCSVVSIVPGTPKAAVQRWSLSAGIQGYGTRVKELDTLEEPKQSEAKGKEIE